MALVQFTFEKSQLFVHILTELQLAECLHFWKMTAGCLNKDDNCLFIILIPLVSWPWATCPNKAGLIEVNRQVHQFADFLEGDDRSESSLCISYERNSL